MPVRRSLLDLSRRARRIFAAAYVLGLAAIIVAGQRAPDHVFGFQMFNESSRMKIQLFRRVAHGSKTRLVPAPGGTWQARDKHGTLRTYRWNDRVKDGVLGRLETRVHASYGLEGQLFRLGRALEDFLLHIPEDTETKALVAVVETSKNGRDPERVRLTAVRP